MPVPLRSTHSKAEAKYNVTTEFSSLGLHSAAATGNVGLVEYALTHGQPINSVLDGVLPLHAACAGGSTQVVKLLIDHGADVNAPRLPRKYSNDKNRDASTPIVGTSGSTPLHFAAANGNTAVVRLLLLHGAHANRSDKHGVTPEMLARQNGWEQCAIVLNEWAFNKDRDLRERERVKQEERDGDLGFNVMGTNASTSTSTRKRLHVKRSIDTALHIMRSTAAEDPQQQQPSTSYALRPLGGESYTFYANDTPPSPSSPTPPSQQCRRPSLPQIMSASQAQLYHNRHRKTSASTSRPRSAGTDASPPSDNNTNTSTPTNTNNTYSGRGTAPSHPPTPPSQRKLGSKYSLLHLFKKGQAPTDSNGNSNAHPSSTPSNSTSPPPNGSGSAHQSSVATSIPASFTEHQLRTSSPSPIQSPEMSTTDINSSNTASVSKSGFRFRLGSDASGNGSVCGRSPPANSPPFKPRPLPISTTNTTSTSSSQNSNGNGNGNSTSRPLAIELHNALAQAQAQSRERSGSSSGSSPNSHRFDLGKLGLGKRDRSGSGSGEKEKGNRSGGLFDTTEGMGVSNRSGTVFDDDVVVLPGKDKDKEKEETRPGILREHNRSSLSGLSRRALRFDSSSSSGGRWKEESGVRLRASNSVGSLGKATSASALDVGLEGERTVIDTDVHLRVPGSAPAAISDFEIVDGGRHDEDVIVDLEDDELEEYGQSIVNVIVHDHDDDIHLNPKSHLTALLIRERESSFTSSSDESPFISPVDEDLEALAATVTEEFPFSINRPPPSMPSPSEEILDEQRLLQVPSMDIRGRGDSVSSSNTTDSMNPQLSISGTTTTSTSGSESVTVSSPVLRAPSDSHNTNNLPPFKPNDVISNDHDDDNVVVVVHSTSGDNLNQRRSHPPLADINISSISSHAQAEALVQRAQKSILEMADTPPSTGTGWTPLSARLAAYGESLALERKLREKEAASIASGGGREQDQHVKEGGEPPVRNKSEFPRVGVERQFSLEHKRTAPRSRMKQPRRPHTSGSTPEVSTATDNYFTRERAYRHQQTRSASAVVPPQSPQATATATVSSSPLPSRSRNTIQPEDDSDIDEYRHPIVHSHTPEPDPVDAVSPVLTLSRTSSMTGDVTGNNIDKQGGSGVPLYRVSTAPSTPLRNTNTGTGTSSNRIFATNTKLTRMGFATPDSAARLQQQGNGSGGGKRFGGLKHLMQSLKGKP